jgi:predicted NAD-dependent protein-ADP-ribosyltransferase YbiA (DUF1768 family)
MEIINFNETIFFIKKQNNNCYSVFNENKIELSKNNISKSEVYAFLRTFLKTN